MLLAILFGVLFLYFAFMFIFRLKKLDDFGAGLWFLMTFGILIIFAVLINELSNINTYTNNIVKNYTILKDRIENTELTNQSFYVLDDLYEDVTYMDNIIERNKKNRENILVKEMFSEKVAGLEPLEPLFINKFKKENEIYKW